MDRRTRRGRANERHLDRANSDHRGRRHAGGADRRGGALTLSRRQALAAPTAADERDIVYCTAAGVPLTMDLYRPPDRERPAPAVLFVHGGGWTAGDKSR
ncbi:MAG: hypothetical protein U0531_18560 [Dehalococcoidia bacterium]